MQITIQKLIEQRRVVWKKHHDPGIDSEYAEMAAREILSRDDLRREIREKPWLLIPCCFTIVDKNAETVPFFFNAVQEDFIQKLENRERGRPLFVLKGRQQGFTSIITALQLAFAITRRNFSGFTMADRSDNTRTIFNDKARMVLDRLPQILRPHEKFNSANELFFDKLNASWRVATATEQVGRSRTLNFVHLSEVAFFECNLASIQAGIGQAITADGIQIYETTANGFNQAKELWDSHSCINIFYQWWKTPEYSVDLVGNTAEEHLQAQIDDGKAISSSDHSWILERIAALRELGVSDRQIGWYVNKFVSYIDKSLIRQEYPINPEEAFISSGQCMFDRDTITNMLARAMTRHDRRGSFLYDRVMIPVTGERGQVVDQRAELRNIRFVESPDGFITIHSEPRVNADETGFITAKCPYVIGGDTAGDGEDFFTAKCIDNTNGKTVATLHKQFIDEDLYAEQVLCMAKFYNDAYIGLEINFSRHPTRIITQKYGYTNFYMRERLDALTDKVVEDYGFNTTVSTKPMLINNLISVFRENPGIECDAETLREMSTFVRLGERKMGAVEGAHDDLVMALAIAHFISSHAPHDFQEQNRPKDDFLQRNFKTFENYSGGNESFMIW